MSAVFLLFLTVRANNLTSFTKIGTAPQGICPAGQSLHSNAALGYCNNVIYFIGGGCYGPPGVYSILNTVYTFDMNKAEPSWQLSQNLKTGMAVLSETQINDTLYFVANGGYQYTMSSNDIINFPLPSNCVITASSTVLITSDTVSTLFLLCGSYSTFMFFAYDLTDNKSKWIRGPDTISVTGLFPPRSLNYAENMIIVVFSSNTMDGMQRIEYNTNISNSSWIVSKNVPSPTGVAMNGELGLYFVDSVNNSVMFYDPILDGIFDTDVSILFPVGSDINQNILVNQSIWFWDWENNHQSPQTFIYRSNMLGDNLT